MNVLRKNTAEKFCSYAFLPVCTFLFFIFVSGISHGKGMPGSFRAIGIIIIGVTDI